MQTRTIRPVTHPVRGRSLSLPGSKSITNRALLLAVLAEGETLVSNCLISDDSRYMHGALKTLGAPVEMDEVAKTCRVNGPYLPEGRAGLFVGNSGTTIRFLASYLSLGRGEFVLDGEARMHERPIADLIDALGQLGCKAVSLHGNGCPPVQISARGMEGGVCRIAGSVSSQFLSSLLLASPYSRKGVTIRTEGEVVSKPYIDMTLRMMEQFGVAVERDDYREFRIAPGRYRAVPEYRVEPDASTASYFLAATAILGGRTVIDGIGSDSLQGDARFAEVLGQMGCRVDLEGGRVVLESDGKLTGVDVNLNAIPDMVMTLAVTALFADSPTRITDVANLRVKESERLAATAAELTKLGADVVEFEDGLEIRPSGNYRPASVTTYNDHRIAMSFALAGLKIDGVVIEDPSCVSKTFPEYFDVLEKFVD